MESRVSTVRMIKARNAVRAWLKSMPSDCTTAPRIGHISSKKSLNASTVFQDIILPLVEESPELGIAWIVPSHKRRIASSMIDDALPLHTRLTLDSPQTCTARVLKSNLSLIAEKHWLNEAKIISTRQEQLLAVNSLLAFCDPSRIRPVVSPYQYNTKILDLFNTLGRVGITQSEYKAWVSVKHELAKSSVDLGLHDDLVRLLAQFETTLKKTKHLTPFEAITQCEILLKDALERTGSSKELARHVWDLAPDLVIISNVDDLSPLEVSLICQIIRLPTAASLLITCDKEDSVDRWQPLARCANAMPFIQARLNVEPICQIGDTSPKQHRIALPSPEQTEISFLTSWIQSKLGEKGAMVVAAPTHLQQKNIAAGLEVALKPLSIEVLPDAGRFDILEHLIVKPIHFLLSIVIRGSRLGVDRELYHVLTSAALPYNISASDLKEVGELCTKRHLPFHDALEMIETGRRLLKDVKFLGESVARQGMNLSLIASQIIRYVRERLSSDASQKWDQESNALSEYLDLIGRSEISIRKLHQAAAPPMLWEILAYAESSADRYISEFAHPEHLKPSDFGGRKVHVMTFATLCQLFEPESVRHLALAGMARSFPSRFRRKSLPLPWDLIESPNIFVKERPQVDWHVNENTMEGHVEIQRRLLHSALSRSCGDSLAVSYEPSQGEVSPFLRELGIIGSPVQQMNDGNPRSSDDASRTSAVRRARPSQLGQESYPSLNSRQFSTANHSDSKDSNVLVPKHPLTLSFSRILEYTICPKRYYLSRVIGIKPGSNPRMVFGKALHAGVETYLMSALPEREESSRNAFVEAFDEEFDMAQQPLPDGFESAKHIAEVRDFGLRMLEEFQIKWRNTYLDRVISAEQHFELHWSQANVTLIGVIDLVERSLSNGTVSIVDFKSNALDIAKLRRLSKAYMQLDLYAWAYERSFGEKPHAVALESIETGQRFSREPASSEVVENMLTTVSSAIRRKDFVATPSFGNCSMCPFKTVCSDNVVGSRNR